MDISKGDKVMLKSQFSAGLQKFYKVIRVSGDFVTIEIEPEKKCGCKKDQGLSELSVSLPLPASKNSCRSWEQVH